MGNTKEVMKRATILGAIAGDIAGSAYEFHPTKNKNFDLFHAKMDYTDDTLMTIAVAHWIMSDSELSAEKLVASMQSIGRRFRCPKGGYGGGFKVWLQTDSPKPYNSWGNGSAMRVSACGFAFDSLEKTLDVAKRSAEVTHNHPEGIKGAQATAAAIFMARTGKSKEEIREYIEQTFGYNLSRTCDDIRPTYSFEKSCQETVPQSIVAFLDSTDYEDAIRLTVSLGGDADTMGAITGAIAIAYYKEMPSDMYDNALRLLDRHARDLKEIVVRFENEFAL